jgi:hypothetical protein
MKTLFEFCCEYTGVLPVLPTCAHAPKRSALCAHAVLQPVQKGYFFILTALFRQGKGVGIRILQRRTSERGGNDIHICYK